MKVSLNGIWQYKREDEEKWRSIEVPSSILTALLKEKKIEDPFYRDNELKIIDVLKHNYEYRTTFIIEEDFLQNDAIKICFEGLDTICVIKLNGVEIGKTNNMHICHQFEVKDRLIVGENSLHIYFHSVINYIQHLPDHQKEWAPGGVMKGYQSLRKAHYMFGWDWGPQIPDLGVFRDVYIDFVKKGEINSVYVRQTHYENRVVLKFDVDITTYKELKTVIKLFTPDGEYLGLKDETIEIENPLLWWPYGYGEQPLYKLTIELYDNDILIDERSDRIGLRDLKVRREKDQWGESFEFVINGVPIFMKGANYVPEDNLIGRFHKNRTKQLLEDCILANFNCIRVWGGGLYCEDYFYDICDELGLVVWQDFMFACAYYDLTAEFEDNISKEIRYNMRRLRNHTCIGIWCGNNENEWGFSCWNMKKTPKLKLDYIKQYEVLFAKIAQECDPDRLYWPSSPSSGEGLNDPNSERMGDAHYWEVWHSLKPFTEYRKTNFRFMSEFGFQSFPCFKTVKTFTNSEDWYINSYVMEQHQKNGSANGNILYYMAQTLKFPSSFEEMLYCSQVLQAEAIKYGVEHWRQIRGRCMGTIYWQLNDSWPVASWSSIDSTGRWKALHYAAKRFFVPVFVSARLEDNIVGLYVTNDNSKETLIKLKWNLYNGVDEIIDEGSISINAQPCQSTLCHYLDYRQIMSIKETMFSTYLFFSIEQNDTVISDGTLLFTSPKHYKRKQPDLKIDISGDEITIKSDVFVQYVAIDFTDADCVLSDNFFDLLPSISKTVKVIRKNNEISISNIKITHL